MIGALGLFILAQILIRRYSRNYVPKEDMEGFYILKLPLIQSVLQIGFWVAWFYAFDFLKDLSPTRVTIAIIMLTFALTFLVLNYKSQLRYNTQGLHVPNWYGKTTFYNWSDIKSINANSYRHGMFNLENGGHIRFNTRYMGITHFLDYTQKMIGS